MICQCAQLLLDVRENRQNTNIKILERETGIHLELGQFLIEKVRKETLLSINRKVRQPLQAEKDYELEK